MQIAVCFAGVRVGKRDGEQRGAGASLRQEAQHRRHHGRRYRLVQRRRLPPGPDVFDDAEPRQDGQRRHALHRLLRGAELHRRPRQFHHRRTADPHRPDHGRPGRRQGRHSRRGPDDRDRVEGDGLRHRPVRQEPSGRPEPIPADRAWVRRVFRLPLSPRRDGGPVLALLSAGVEGQGRTAQPDPQLRHHDRRSDGAAALGQDRQAEDRGRRAAAAASDAGHQAQHGDDRRRHPRLLREVHRQGQGGRQAVLHVGQSDPRACHLASVAEISGEG